MTPPADPVARQVELVRGLLAQVDHLLAAGSPVDAVAPAGEAVAVARVLAGQDPPRFLALLADTLSAQVGSLAAAGRDEAAVAAAEEWVAVLRQLVPTDMEVALAGLATALYELADRRTATGRQDAAMAAFAEATEVRRRTPPPYRPAAGELPAPAAGPEDRFATPLDAVAAVGDVVGQLRCRVGAEPQLAPVLGRWLQRLAVEFRNLGYDGEVELATAELAALHYGPPPGPPPGSP